MFNYDMSNKWYEMENINGIPISRLYLNEELTIQQFDHVIGTINRIHLWDKSSAISRTQLCEGDGILRLASPDSNQMTCDLRLPHLVEIASHRLEFYDNYEKKLKKRYENYDYSIFPNSEKIYKLLISKLRIYENENLGKYSIIHGDTVFTNILINRFGKIKLIDMRGKINETLTIYGDKLYDWGKLYQSLIGYDEILENKEISNNYKKTFLDHFEQKFLSYFSENDFYYLKIITASLLFSLIPLHNNDKCLKYYNLIEKLNIEF